MEFLASIFRSTKGTLDASQVKPQEVPKAVPKAASKLSSTFLAVLEEPHYAHLAFWLEDEMNSFMESLRRSVAANANTLCAGMDTVCIELEEPDFFVEDVMVVEGDGYSQLFKNSGKSNSRSIANRATTTMTNIMALVAMMKKEEQGKMFQILTASLAENKDMYVQDVLKHLVGGLRAYLAISSADAPSAGGLAKACRELEMIASQVTALAPEIEDAMYARITSAIEKSTAQTAEGLIGAVALGFTSYKEGLKRTRQSIKTFADYEEELMETVATCVATLGNVDRNILSIIMKETYSDLSTKFVTRLREELATTFRAYMESVLLSEENCAKRLKQTGTGISSSDLAATLESNNSKLQVYVVSESMDKLDATERKMVALFEK
jgi:hypothetical protein